MNHTKKLSSAKSASSKSRDKSTKRQVSGSESTNTDELDFTEGAMGSGRLTKKQSPSFLSKKPQITKPNN